jgi:DNA-binding response OmpR family regulator
MLLMQEKDSANTLPGGGNMSALNEVTSIDAQIFVQPGQTLLDDAKAVRRILVVEDDASLANLEADILTAHGFRVAIAGTGEMAVNTLRQFLPDLVLLDLELAGTMTGWDVLQVLRMHASVPVLLTSAETAVRQRIRSRGESRLTLDHLPKPYPMQTLLKRIKRMLMA